MYIYCLKVLPKTLVNASHLFYCVIQSDRLFVDNIKLSLILSTPKEASVHKFTYINLGLKLNHFVPQTDKCYSNSVLSAVARKRGFQEIQLLRRGISKYCYETTGAKSGATN